MRKRRGIVLILIVIIITSVTTFTISNLIQLKVDDKIFINEKEYYRLKDLEQRFDKLLYLEEYIKRNFYKNADELQFDEYIIKGLFETLDDPYSVYMTAEEYERFSELNSGSYSGIGVIVTAADDNYITVVSPIDGSPGDKAGLKSGDKILKVDNTAISSKDIDHAVSLIKGQAGTDVVLTIYREGLDSFDVTITRANIVIKSVESEMLDDKIGYLEIKLFDDKSYYEFKENINKLLDQGMEALIIDLRNNPGGSYNEVVNIADMLLGEQVIVYTEDRDGNREIEKSDKYKIDLPLVVLVNEGSASASEILTAAIQDSKAGVVIGSKTFGKGVVQGVRSLEDGSAIKLTISEYFTPNGKNIDGSGIYPDYDIEQIKQADYIIDDEHDGVLEFAIDYIKSLD